MSLTARISAALRPVQPTHADLLALVRVIDLAWTTDLDLVERLVARMTVLAAPLYVQRLTDAGSQARITATARAAEAWLRDPSDDHHDAFFTAATASFPFGPGDGCLAASELGGHGTPGAGCRSGAGFIATLFPADDDLRDRVEAARARLRAGDLTEPEMFDVVRFAPWLGVHAEMVYDDVGNPRCATTPRPEVPVPDLTTLFAVFREHGLVSASTRATS